VFIESESYRNSGGVTVYACDLLITLLDIANPEHPVEVSRVVIDGTMLPHWSSYDAKTHRAWPQGWTGTAQAHGVVFSR
jgi:hypothetical protein